jgi:Adenylate and Guanylate cyclase catalytic domain
VFLCLQYRAFTQAVKTVSESEFSDFAQAMFSLAQSITVAGQTAAAASALDDSPFPFVRIPMFEVHGSQARKFSGVEVVAWSPIVTEAQRPFWAEFVQQQQGWYEESKILLSYTSQEENNDDDDDRNPHGDSNSSDSIRPYIWYGNRTGDDWSIPSPPGAMNFAPIWQTSPPPYSRRMLLNYDLLSEPLLRKLLPAVDTIRHGLATAADLSWHHALDHHSHRRHGRRLLHSKDDKDEKLLHPHSSFMQPVFDGLDVWNSKLVGVVTSTVSWDIFLARLLPPTVSGITAVLTNTCNQTYTYVINGPEVQFQGTGDLHNPKYESTKFVIPVIAVASAEMLATPGHCVYTYCLYFSDAFRSKGESNLAVITTTLIAVIFALMAFAFAMYDRFVQRRNDKIVRAAVTSHAFLSTLFPSQVKKRLLAENQETNDQDNSVQPRRKRAVRLASGGGAVTNDEDDEMVPLSGYNSKPIADLFTETTILFADLAGFSAWSSVREPSQVFMLLETLFRSFDEIAKKHNVFKVCFFLVHFEFEYRRFHQNLLTACVVYCNRLKRSGTVTWQWRVCPRFARTTPWSWPDLPAIACSRCAL